MVATEQKPWYRATEPRLGFVSKAFSSPCKGCEQEEEPQPPSQQPEPSCRSNSQALPSSEAAPAARGITPSSSLGKIFPSQIPPEGIKVYANVPDLFSEHLTCPACSDLLSSPVAVKNRCQHVFCRGCVQQSFRDALESGKSEYPCAVCGEAEQVQWEAGTWVQPELEPSLLAKAMLEQLTVRCRFGLSRGPDGTWSYPGDAPDRCSAVLHQMEVKKHEETCPHAIVRCPIPRCGTVMLQRNAGAHMHEAAMQHCESLLTENVAIKEVLNSTRSKLKDSHRELKALKEQAIGLEAKLAETEATLLLHNARVEADASVAKLQVVGARDEEARGPVQPLEGHKPAQQQLPQQPQRPQPQRPHQQQQPQQENSGVHARVNENESIERLLPKMPPLKKIKTKVMVSLNEARNLLQDSGPLFAPVTSLEMMADVNMLADACASASDNNTDILSRGPEPDGYNWRKYGEKRVKQSPFTRSYYKCSVPNCPMRKIVELDFQARPQGTTYKGGEHNHVAPATNRPLKIKPKRPV